MSADALATLLQQPLQFPGAHSALAPSGPQAARIHALWQFMWIVSTVVWVIVVLAALYATFRRRRPAVDAPPAADPVQDGPAMRNAVIGATALTSIILFVFLILDFRTGRALTAPPRGALAIKVTGHQWWWEVQYPSPRPDEIVTTANEIHVPVGRPVVLELRSADVIHSFWPPSLVGKRDLIPGYTSSLWFRADRAGLYRGQCAEFCGHQHAKMAFSIVVEPPEKFAAWLTQQRYAAHTPTDSLPRRGQEVFLSSSCVMCHSIQGTPAGSRIGPDLTHLATRLTIAAGTLPNTRGNLAGWIVDPQSIKPGAQMPSNQLSPGDLQALLAYLGTLQ
jgi:cytochrome c oxidase subunit 2